MIESRSQAGHRLRMACSQSLAQSVSSLCCRAESGIKRIVVHWGSAAGVDLPRSEPEAELLLLNKSNRKRIKLSGYSFSGCDSERWPVIVGKPEVMARSSLLELLPHGPSYAPKRRQAPKRAFTSGPWPVASGFLTPCAYSNGHQPSKYVCASKTFLRSRTHEQTGCEHRDLHPHRTAVHPNDGAESCQKAPGESLDGSARPRQTVDRNVGDSPTAVHARESPELPEPKPAPHRAYQRWRDESQDQDLEHLW